MEKKRLLFIDVLRGLAVFAMIETHLVNSIMFEGFRYGFIWNSLNIMNGFISVAFLFMAGATFNISAKKKFLDYKSFKKPLWLYLRKLGFILILAYMLHLPVLSIFRIPHLTYEQFLVWFECDILQNIVYSSLISLFVLLITPKFKYLKYIYAVLALCFIIFTPLVWRIDPLASLPAFLGTIVSDPSVSKFGLFPWSAFFLAGASFSQFFLDRTDKEKFAFITIMVSIVVVILCFATSDYLSSLIQWEDWWKGYPTHTLFRLATMIIFFCLAFLAESRLSAFKHLNFLAIPGKESLLVYYGHLLIIYGSFVNMGIAYMLGPRLHWSSVMLITIAMCTFFYYVSLSWQTLKSLRPNLSRQLMILAGVLILTFMFAY